MTPHLSYPGRQWNVGGSGSYRSMDDQFRKESTKLGGSSHEFDPAIFGGIHSPGYTIRQGRNIITTMKLQC